MLFKRFFVLAMVALIAVSSIAVYGAPKPDKTVDIEVWSTNIGYLPVEKGSPLYNLYKRKMGVGIIQPYVEWNGGITYLQQLNLKIAAGEMPDLFTPWNGIEVDLAKNGAILDLTDLLPKKAPHLWKAIPKEAWDVMRSYDPNGKGRIYAIPATLDYCLMGGLIRKDWLDKLKLAMPKTQADFVKVLEAFRDKDPNGNGQKDEIPTGGRQQLKWMDHLFGMYGLAMWEGNPMWDIYDGKLTYSAVTPNMKAALQFIHSLYEKGLIDKETLLNDKTRWEGKIKANRVGVYYHWVQAENEMLEPINLSFGIKPVYAVLPAISAPGYQGFYPVQKVKTPWWVIKNQKDQAKIDAVFKALDAYANKKLWFDFYFGVNGMHSKVENGKRVLLPLDKTKQQNLLFRPWEDIASLDFTTKLYANNGSERKWMFDQCIQSLKDNQKYGKHVAGDGIPNSIYENYPDIQNRTLYLEYASKIVTGEYPIGKFDEFVEKWHKTGGEEVTKRAREWYAKVGRK